MDEILKHLAAGHPDSYSGSAAMPRKAKRPLCVLAELGDGSKAVVYANREGLLKLRQAIDDVLALDAKSIKFPVFANGNWSWLEIATADQADFDCGGNPCKCGCQLEFAEG